MELHIITETVNRWRHSGESRCIDARLYVSSNN